MCNDKIMTGNQKKENMEIKKFYINLHLNDCLQIHSLQKRADARESANIIYLICDAYR